MEPDQEEAVARIQRLGGEAAISADLSGCMLDDLVGRVASSLAAVLIEGEIGAGNALLAFQIHCRSLRAAGPFVRVPCEELGEPEADADETLFGPPGRTGNATEPAWPGLLRSACGGTFFLQNVPRLPFSTQVKLLDALEGGGGDWPCLPGGGRPDVRVIASTREDLKAAVAANRFYAGLYDFLNVMPISVPPAAPEAAGRPADAGRRRAHRRRPPCAGRESRRQ